MTAYLDNCPALVLNADFRPLSYFPLSLWSWQDAIKAVFLDRVNIIDHYDVRVRSPSLEMQLPSVVSLKEYVPAARHPAFTRFNVFLRDRFTCQYCGEPNPSHELTFDHLVPRSCLATVDPLSSGSQSRAVPARERRRAGRVFRDRLLG